MRKILFIILMFLVSGKNIWPVNNPPYKTTVYDNPSPGYVFLTPYQSQMFSLLDNSANSVFSEKMNYFDEFLNPRLQPNGLISFFFGSHYYIMNESYKVLDSFSCKGNYDTDFHDFILLPNGNVAMLGRENRMADLSKTIPGGKKDVLLIGNIIQEFDKDKNLVFQWNSFDHFNLTDVTSDVDLTQSAIITCHMNSIFYDSDGNIIASSRALDEITKIDRKTGEIIWRLGGKGCKNNQFQFLNDTINGFFGFSHQHSVSRLPNGNLLLFDNGDLRSKPFSRAVEYKLDEQNKTIEKVWEYSDSESTFSYSMGNVQRLPNGNTLIGWGINSRNLTATEVNPDGEKEWELAGYQNYAVYKFIYKMHAVSLNIDKPGLYNFANDTNLTDVILEISNTDNNGPISVEKHFYQPFNMTFTGIKPVKIYDNSWLLSFAQLRNVTGKIKFYVPNLTMGESSFETVYYRKTDGNGAFTPLITVYTGEEGTIEAPISGSGEYLIAFSDSITAPMPVYPPDSSKNITPSTRIVWQDKSQSFLYRLQLSLYPDFSVCITDTSNLSANSFNVDLIYGQTYFWRIKAFNNIIQSPWSKTMTFSTMPVTGTADNSSSSGFSVIQKGNRLFFEFKQNIIGPINISLYDIIGNLVKNIMRKNSTGKNIFDVKIDNLENGVYVYKLMHSNDVNVGKIFIEK